MLGQVTIEPMPLTDKMRVIVVESEMVQVDTNSSVRELKIGECPVGHDDPEYLLLASAIDRFATVQRSRAEAKAGAAE